MEYRNGLGERVCAVETAAREEGLDAQRAPLSVMYEWKSRHLDSKNDDSPVTSHKIMEQKLKHIDDSLEQLQLFNH